MTDSEKRATFTLAIWAAYGVSALIAGMTHDAIVAIPLFALGCWGSFRTMRDAREDRALMESSGPIRKS